MGLSVTVVDQLLEWVLDSVLPNSDIVLGYLSCLASTLSPML